MNRLTTMIGDDYISKNVYNNLVEENKTLRNVLGQYEDTGFSPKALAEIRKIINSVSVIMAEFGV